MKTHKLMAATALAFSSHALASSVNVSFGRITSNSTENVESQFLTTVSTVLGDSAVIDFVFTNNVGIASSISEIYFDNGVTSTLFTAGAIIEPQVGTNFVFGSASPGDLPGGASLSEPFHVTMSFLTDAQGNPSNGVDTSTDLLRIRMTLLSGITFGDVTTAIDSGALRLGLHVRAIGANSNSDSFVSNPPPIVPLPAPALLGAGGLLACLSPRRRRRSTRRTSRS